MLHLPYRTPLLDKAELTLRRSVPVPRMLVEHRKTHGPPSLDPVLFGAEQGPLQRLDRMQVEAIGHVLTRLIEGNFIALEVSNVLVKAEERSGRRPKPAFMYTDTLFVVEACKTYRDRVAGITDDPAAISPGFRAIFHEVLPARAHELERVLDKPDRVRAVAEARLRVVLDIIGHGLGAMTAVWGLNAAMRDVQRGNTPDGRPVSLLALADLVWQVTLIERRSIGDAICRFQELAATAYGPVMRAIVQEYRQVKPLLDTMRGETFSRWGEKFPFDINRRQLEVEAKKQVLSWAKNILLLRSREVTTLTNLL